MKKSIYSLYFDENWKHSSSLLKEFHKSKKNNTECLRRNYITQVNFVIHRVTLYIYIISYTILYSMYIAYIMHFSVYSVRTLYKNLLCAQLRHS